MSLLTIGAGVVMRSYQKAVLKVFDNGKTGGRTLPRSFRHEKTRPP